MVELASTRAFYPSRPNLQIEGEAQPVLSLGLSSLMVFENTQGLYRCEATLGNWGAAGGDTGYLYFDRQLLDFGKALSVSMGDSAAEAEVFKGRITAIEGRYPQQMPPEILILAEDRLQDLRMIRRTRNFDQMSVGDVIARIAADHGLRSDIDLDGPVYRLLTQVNQTDLGFIRECARKVDGEVWIDDNTLHAQARSRRNHEEVRLEYGERLRDFSVMADLACQRSSLVVSGWDTDAKEGIAETADNRAIQSELEGGMSGAQILQDSFGDRVERIVHQMPFNRDEARAMADARFRYMARHFITGQALADGDGRLRVGGTVELGGLGPLFNGKYYLSEVTHSFDPVNGYQTRFSVQRSGLGSE